MAKKSPIQELGFGKHIATNSRFMRPNGTLNVKRLGASLSDNLYFQLLELTWSRFFLLVLAVYISLNILFATIYYLLGQGQLTSTETLTGASLWYECFFFSAQTLTTVGYGRLAPIGFGANVVSTFESFLGLLGFALISGLLYGRFSRPVARIAFSNNLLVAPYKDSQAIMFRIANKSKSELISTDAEMLIAFNETDAQGTTTRAFRNLPLEISHIMFFGMSWTLVHHINENSLLYGLDAEQLNALNPEFLIVIKAIEEANQQTVHARKSYVHEDLIWGARFAPMIGKNNQGTPLVFLDKLSEFTMVSPSANAS